MKTSEPRVMITERDRTLMFVDIVEATEEQSEDRREMSSPRHFMKDALLTRLILVEEGDLLMGQRGEEIQPKSAFNERVDIGEERAPYGAEKCSGH